MELIRGIHQLTLQDVNNIVTYFINTCNSNPFAVNTFGGDKYDNIIRFHANTEIGFVNVTKIFAFM